MMLKDALERFQSQFKTEADCIAFMEETRWPNGFKCPSCSCSDAYRITTRVLPLFECKGCNIQTSLTANTIMHRSRTPIRKWLLTLFLVSSSEGSVNAVRLANLLQVTYKTAWSMLHKIRRLISRWDAGHLLSGDVEAKHEIYMKQIIVTEERMKQEKSIIVARGSGHADEVSVEHEASDRPYYKLKLVGRESEARKPLSDEERQIFVELHCQRQLCSFQFNAKSSPNRKFPYEEVKEYWVDGYHSGNTCEKYSPYGWNAAAVNARIKECPFLYPLSIIAAEGFRWINETFFGIGMKYAQSYIDEYCFRMNYGWGQGSSPLLRLSQLALTDGNNKVDEADSQRSVRGNLSRYNASAA
ncbi:transposase [Paenibacillus sp. J5C_2022]|uniref:transposase n=1 Tax=Paenibacillus sp. J5C2022 TaxID=2977129 RepID=UPI0021D12FF0|nr:transposase [Paenibacillus sp. J5C2022]MCU6707633.1 transposase [Paenibacillus sp. J5C2022]